MGELGTFLDRNIMYLRGQPLFVLSKIGSDRLFAIWWKGLRSANGPGHQETLDMGWQGEPGAFIATCSLDWAWTTIIATARLSKN